MKRFLLVGVSLLTLIGCSYKSQLVTLQANNLIPQKEGLVLDNDTLRLSYQFYSERGQMTLTISNKLNRPLYVDWKRSSLIVGQDKVDYWQDVANVDLTSVAALPRWSLYSTSRTSGTIQKEDPVGFIPPGTTITKTQFVVFPQGSIYLKGQPTILAERSTVFPSSKKPVRIDLFQYTNADQSPFTFRNYLTLSTDKDFRPEFHIDTKFWASEVKVMPQNQLVGAQPPYNYGGDTPETYSGPTLSPERHPYRQSNAFYITMPVQ